MPKSDKYFKEFIKKYLPEDLHDLNYSNLEEKGFKHHFNPNISQSYKIYTRDKSFSRKKYLLVPNKDGAIGFSIRNDGYGDACFIIIGRVLDSQYLPSSINAALKRQFPGIIFNDNVVLRRDTIKHYSVDVYYMGQIQGMVDPYRVKKLEPRQSYKIGGHFLGLHHIDIVIDEKDDKTKLIYYIQNNDSYEKRKREIIQKAIELQKKGKNLKL
jgi:hypothetical protein